MNFYKWFAAALSLAACCLSAATPAPGQLFPSDTLALASAPDWVTFQAAWQKAPFGQLWQDPAMTAFREKTMATFREKVLGEMERGLGVKADDFLPLLQGQVSIAVVANGWNPAEENSEPALVVVFDAKDHADGLKARLAEVRQKLSDAKRPVKTVKIRDIDFTTVTVEPSKPESQPGKKEDDDDDNDPKEKAKPHDWTFGQVDSVFLISDSPKPLEQLVARLSGGAVAVIGEGADFQAAERTASFGTAQLIAWINGSALVNKASIALGGDKDKGGGPMGIDLQKALKVLGLEGIHMAAFSAVFSGDRQNSTFVLSAPESTRGGIIKLLQFPAKDSSPTASVPTDAVRFHRWRLDGQKTWNSIESILASLSPQLSGFLQLSLSTLGKDKDPGFDFRKSFIGNLGDDFIGYDKPARGASPAELANPPSVSLIGAANAEQLLAGLRAATSLIPGTGGEPKTREVNGHTVFAFTMPSATAPAGTTIEAVAAGGYVAIANDPGALDEFIRFDGAAKSLRDQPGLADLAQLAGGMGTGLFGFSDDREFTRARWEAMRSGTADLPAAGAKAKKKDESTFDFKLLPSFDTIAHYFGKSVFSGAWNPEGFQLRTVSVGNH